MDVVYTIDYSYFCYKFREAFQRVKRDFNGVTVDLSVPYGFLRALKYNPFQDIVICLDAAPLLNANVWPPYKGQRIKEPKDGVSFPQSEVVKMLTAVGPLMGKNITVVASPHQEADQVIASLVYKVLGKVPASYQSLREATKLPFDVDPYLKRFATGLKTTTFNPRDFSKVVVASSDSDLYQLYADSRVLVDLSTSGGKITDGFLTPKAVFNLKPTAIPSLKALKGDNSDNIPPLQLPIKQKDLIDLIGQFLDNPQKLNNFINYIQNGSGDIHPKLETIAKHIRDTGQLQQLKINNKISELGFVSLPYKLEYPTYDIKESLKKYNIKW